MPDLRSTNHSEQVKFKDLCLTVHSIDFIHTNVEHDKTNTLSSSPIIITSTPPLSPLVCLLPLVLVTLPEGDSGE